MIDYIEDVSKRDWVEGRKYFMVLKSNDDWSFKMWYPSVITFFIFARFVILKAHRFSIHKGVDMNHRIAILSDIHGDTTALEAVIADARAQGATEYWL